MTESAANLPSQEINMVIPVNASPTDVLAERFASWRKIIRGLNVYFKEVASVNDEVVRHNVRLGHAVSFPFFENGTSDGAEANAHNLNNPENYQTKEMFLDVAEGSIADVPGSIISFHRAQAAAASRTSKELSMNVIPRLEDLRRDLVVKIKEIKSLSSDFKNSVAKEQTQTQKELQQFSDSVEVMSTNPTLLSSKQDPYLLKLGLDRQLSRQINEENYLLEAYQNLQSSGRELEEVVVQEVQQALAVYGKLLGVQGKNLTEISNKIMTGYVAKDAAFEWDAFVKRDPNFVNPSLKSRTLNDVVYPHQNSVLASEIRSGYLERRSKYLKSYSRAWYVLTPAFLHEFKSSDRKKDPTPVMSISLNDCQITEDNRKTSSHKFILQTRQHSNHHHNHKGHNWVFRAESADKLKEWYNDLSKLTSLSSPLQRARSFRGEPQPLVTLQGASSTALDKQRDQQPQQQQQQQQQQQGRPLQQPQQQQQQSTMTSATTVSTIPSTAGHSAVETGHQRNISDLDQQNNVMIASPVPSDTSAVTSNGEPFETSTSPEETTKEETTTEYEDANVGTYDESEERGGPQRGRFPSEVKLDKSQPVDPAKATDSDTLHREANTFIVPADYNTSETAVADDTSVFSYDLNHTHSTYHDDKDFKPVNSDVPVEVERRLTQTSHKMEDPRGIGVARKSTQEEADMESAIQQRRASVKSVERKPSRKPTKSFGTEDLKPLTSSDNQQQPNTGLFFSNGLPETTGGKDQQK
ncbi:hypothetical protein TRICI_000867 [Trichomonascus ciferrii]|uniref:PH domain-containing protein n=1 Tax=Trichomonascus ciferrii TaxID=44093 RepID=A0A642VB73_9ASCO|nr:hypothetical protein TRICI_000867 [Trichomonascus ciferrii]